jgi:hypothetical protein
MTVTPEEGTTADAGPDLSVCPGDEVTIGRPGVAGTTYSWSPTDGLDNPSIAQPTASPTATTVYTLTITRGACMAS